MKFRIVKCGIFFNVHYKHCGFWFTFKSSHQGGGISKTEYFTLEDAKAAIDITIKSKNNKTKNAIVFEIDSVDWSPNE